MRQCRGSLPYEMRARKSVTQAHRKLTIFDRRRLHARDRKPNTKMNTRGSPSDLPRQSILRVRGNFRQLHCVRAVRTGEAWIGAYTFLLEMEFEVFDEEGRDEFIPKAKAATRLAEHRSWRNTLIEDGL